ncbi:MAG: UDP-N-acetylmuramoyl-L-alanine--D-glutamate ligase [Aestuariivita sp.]|nr:UDP-N-acetylmuramoyl-L-alanine--D-glutamate ligase [Aestuariivita sp.]MCY4345569.1 UDP-N-acetylmuramoyl-L-alanine--D-glutamate ligase [Aestuariivita sp.]
MIPVQGFEGQTVAILGLGLTGLSAAQSLMAGGAKVIAWDDNAEARAAATSQKIAMRDLHAEKAMSDVSLLIASPGIPHLYPAPHPVIASARAVGIPIDNDIGLFFRSIEVDSWSRFDVSPRIIAVTGSNGKSTTAALIRHILESGGIPCQLAGNIGRGVLDLNPLGDGEVIVLELASYQTELARTLIPDIAVFTNLSPDHLDRHGGFGGYFAAKCRLFLGVGLDKAIIGVDEAEGRFLAERLTEGAHDNNVIRISVIDKLSNFDAAVVALKGFLQESRKGRQIASIDLRECVGLPGAHNHQNACAAYAVARALHLPPKRIAKALRSFSGLPHRSQWIADAGGVVFVNDSKATNVDSAIKALTAFASVRWICGGLAKDGGLQALNGRTKMVKKAYVIGRDAASFAMALNVETEVCRTMARAVEQAIHDAEPGDTVLLAPAAASFDQYDNFEQRGEDFVTEVRQRLGNG